MGISIFERCSIFAIAIGCLAIISSFSALAAEDTFSGEQEFQESCAVCHGASATGDGPLAGILNIPPPDLTELRKRNNGIFPYEDTFSVIDGRANITSHGTKDMPVWGMKFRLDSEGPEAHARTLELVLYLQSVQKK